MRKIRRARDPEGKELTRRYPIGIMTALELEKITLPARPCEHLDIRAVDACTTEAGSILETRECPLCLVEQVHLTDHVAGDAVQVRRGPARGAGRMERKAQAATAPHADSATLRGLLATARDRATDARICARRFADGSDMRIWADRRADAARQEYLDACNQYGETAQYV